MKGKSALLTLVTAFALAFAPSAFATNPPNPPDTGSGAADCESVIVSFSGFNGNESANHSIDEVTVIVNGTMSYSGSFSFEGPTGTLSVAVHDLAAGTYPATASATWSENGGGSFANSFTITCTAGPAGTDGTDGTDGVDGVDGVDGTDGTDGVDGTDGTDGVDGTDGTDGVDGTDGETGATGPPGPQGEQGETGATGATGAAGASGQNGSNGSNGSSGSNGSNGANGKDGRDGTNGTNGTNGLDADICVNLDGRQPSVPAGKVLTLNPAGALVCVKPATAKKWHAKPKHAKTKVKARAPYTP